MKRQEKETYLIEDDVNTIIDGAETSYLVDLLRDGFVGYKNFTNKELNEEFKCRFEYNYL